MGVTSFISEINRVEKYLIPGFLAKNIKEESKQATYLIVFCISGPVVLKIILQMLPSVEVFTKLNPL